MAADDDDPFADIGRGAATVDPFAEIGVRSPQQKIALDIAKQLGAGLVSGTEAIPAFPAQVAGFVGRYLPRGDEERAREQETLRALIERQRGGGIAQYLPEPETTLGKYARSATEFVPSMVAGGRGLVRPALAGASAGLTSEAAGQATEGTAAEIPARLAGGLVGGAAALRAGEAAAARAAVPTRAATEAAGGQLYDQFRNSGFSLHPDAARVGYATPLKQELIGRGLTPRTTPDTWGVITDIERDPYTSPTQFQERYKELGAVAQKATDSQERLAANIAQERLLNALENPHPAHVLGGDPLTGAALLQEANANWASAKRAENVERATVKAEQRAGGAYSGLNLENQLRQRIGALAEPGARTARAYSPSERAAIRAFQTGGPIENTLRYLGNLGGGGGGLGGLAAFGVGGAAAGGLASGGDPYQTGGAGALAALLGGRTMRALSNRMALARARELEQMLLSRSPLAAQTNIPRPSPALPLATLVPQASTLATLGQTPEGYPYYQAR
jgi:hypothetical protein